MFNYHPVDKAYKGKIMSTLPEAETAKTNQKEGIGKRQIQKNKEVKVFM
jgi:hypothetical protein